MGVLKLKQKGMSASMKPIKNLIVTMKWTTAADFDLSAVYKTKWGDYGIAYFGELGSLNTFPYIELSGDEGVGDTGGDNEEVLRISKLDDMDYVWIMCWDYTMVQKGKPARFKNSDILLIIEDDEGMRYEVPLDTGNFGNTAVIATIDNSSGTPMLINESKVGTLKGLNDLAQLLDVIGVEH